MDSLLFVIAQGGLLLGQPSTWAIIGIVGFIAINRPAFGRALLILFFCMIANPFLKAIFQEPLPQPMDGWGFPSGHMQASFVFWGWLAVEARHFWSTFLIAVLLLVIGYGIVYAGYHYPRDILAGVCFGAIILVGYHALNQIPFFKAKPYALALPLLIIGILLLWTLPEARKLHTWVALGGLSGLSIGWGLSNHLLRTSATATLVTRLLQLGIAFIGVYAIQKGVAAHLFSLPLFVEKFCQTFLMGLWISIVPALYLRSKQPSQRLS